MKARWAFCPIKRLRSFLEGRSLWSEAEEEAMQAEQAAAIEEAVERYRANPPPPPSAMFEHAYARLPDAYRAQLDEMLAFAHA